MICSCCHKKERKRDRRTDEWQGRLDDYCTDCASYRCDAFPGECRNVLAIKLEQVRALYEKRSNDSR